MKSIREISAGLQFIDSIDMEDAQAYEKIRDAFIDIRFLPAFTNIFYKIGNENKPNVTFRTRTHKKEKYFKNIEEVCHPKEKYVSSFARCNVPNQSVFYSSENRPTSYMELVEYWAQEKKIGEKVSVSIGVWEFQKDMNLYIIPKPNVNERRTREERFYGAMYDRKMAERKYTVQQKQASDLVFNYMYEKFSKPAKNDKLTYMITSAFSNLMLSQEHIDGILYPSVPFAFKGYNSAIKKSFVESGGLKLIEVTKDTLKIGETENGKHHFKQIDTCSTNKINQDKGDIKWNQVDCFFKSLIPLKYRSI